MGIFLNKTVNFNVISVVSCFKCDVKHNNILLRIIHKKNDHRNMTYTSDCI